MKKIVFFGLGAVGSIMATCLAELSEKNQSRKTKFIFIVRNKKEAEQYLFKSRDLIKESNFVEVRDFAALFADSGEYAKELSDSDIFINAATPEFNDEILKLSVKFGAPYCDLASDMYNEKTLQTLRFPQQDFSKKLKEKNIFGLINAGISPGVTNFLVGEKLLRLEKYNASAKIESVHLYLFEQIESEQVIFSWAPKVALDELEQKPRYIQGDSLITIEPFSNSTNHEFPHFKEPVAEYPIYQEELLSFHNSFPDIQSLKIFSGGSEIELIKNLFQLNLLSKNDIACIADNLSVERIVRMVLPGLQSSRKIEEMNASGVIKYAQFSAMAEIRLVLENPKGKSASIIETTGLSFHRYKELLKTPYSGATYVSYPTGIGAAVLLFYTHQIWKNNKELLSGIIKTEDLASKMDISVVDTIKREMSSYMIDFVSHTHSL